jgi:hypothetical protein
MIPGIYIAQLLCPSRHCMIAAANRCDTQDEVDRLAATTEEQFRQMVESQNVKPYCAICGSQTIHVEAQRTRFATMDEALPHLNRLAEEQRQTHEFLEWSRN